MEVYIISYSTSFTQGITLLLIMHSMHEKCQSKTVPTKILAEYAGIPFATTAKTIKSLNVAGIISSKEGAGGGSMLSKSISQITLLDIFMAVEQDAPLFKIHTGINCDFSYVDDLKKRVEICIDKASDVMKDSLKNITLSDIWTGKIC